MVAKNGPRKGRGGDPSAHNRERADARGGSDDAELLAELKALGAELLEITRLRWHRLRLTAREGAHSLALGAWVAVVAIVTSVLATGLLVLGAAGGIAELAGDRPWVGRLVIGAALLCTTFVLLGRQRRNMRRDFLQDLERREAAGNAADRPAQ